MDKIQIGMLIFPKMTQLDFTGIDWAIVAHRLGACPGQDAQTCPRGLAGAKSAAGLAVVHGSVFAV